MRVRKSFRLPAKVMRSTLSASCPSRIRTPEAPTLRSPETGSTVCRPMISVMSTPSWDRRYSSGTLRSPARGNRLKVPTPGLLPVPRLALPVGATPISAAVFRVCR